MHISISNTNPSQVLAHKDPRLQVYKNRKAPQGETALSIHFEHGSFKALPTPANGLMPACEQASNKRRLSAIEQQVNTLSQIASQEKCKRKEISRELKPYQCTLHTPSSLSPPSSASKDLVETSSIVSTTQENFDIMQRVQRLEAHVEVLGKEVKKEASKRKGASYQLKKLLDSSQQTQQFQTENLALNIQLEQARNTVQLLRAENLALTQQLSSKETQHVGLKNQVEELTQEVTILNENNEILSKNCIVLNKKMTGIRNLSEQLNMLTESD